jgi:hypothetical protein
MNWLWSYLAIKTRLTFLTAIELLAYSLCAGAQGPKGDSPLALAFCGIAYPVACSG